MLGCGVVGSVAVARIPGSGFVGQSCRGESSASPPARRTTSSSKAAGWELDAPTGVSSV